MAANKQNTTKARAKVQEILSKLDVDLVGVARIGELKGSKLKESALKLLPSARSIVVVGMEVFPEFLDLTAPKRLQGAPAMNDLLARHVEHLRGRMGKAIYDISAVAHKAGYQALPLGGQGPAVDGRFLEAVISYKHAAEAAGLGNIGMSSLLVTKRYGPRVQLALCLTEAELESTAGKEQKNCRYCNICVAKCPARALGRPGKGEAYLINKFACRTYFDAAGGCSECMRVCPVASPRYEQ